MEPKSIRYNNPGNLRPMKEGFYKGQVGVDEGGFALFETAEMGQAALDQDIRIKLGRKPTVDAFIDQYSGIGDPQNSRASVDNYKIAVMNGLGLDSSDQVIADTPENRAKMRKIIAEFESGVPEASESKEPLAPSAPSEEPGIMNKAAGGLREGAYGVAKDIGNFIKENPQTAFDLGTLGVGAYAASKIPGVRPLISGGLKNMGGMAADVGRLGAAKAGQVAGDIGQSAKYYGDVAKTGTSDVSRSQVKYPKIGKALTEAGPKATAIAESPIARAAVKLGIPLELLLRSGSLNEGEEEELAKRRKMAPTITPR